MFSSSHAQNAFHPRREARHARIRNHRPCPVGHALRHDAFRRKFPAQPHGASGGRHASPVLRLPQNEFRSGRMLWLLGPCEAHARPARRQLAFRSCSGSLHDFLFPGLSGSACRRGHADHRRGRARHHGRLGARTRRSLHAPARRRAAPCSGRTVLLLMPGLPSVRLRLRADVPFRASWGMYSILAKIRNIPCGIRRAIFCAACRGIRRAALHFRGGCACVGGTPGRPDRHGRHAGAGRREAWPRLWAMRSGMR